MEERITDHASQQAPCRKVHFPSPKTAFLCQVNFFTICSLYFLNFGVIVNKKMLVNNMMTALTVKDFSSSVIMAARPHS